MSLSPNNITKGGQITAYRFKMFNQVNSWFSFWVILIFVGCSLLGFYKFTSDEIIDNGVTYEVADSFSSLDNIIGGNNAKTFSAKIYRSGTLIKKVPLSLDEVLKSDYMKSMGKKFMLRLQLFVGIGAGISCLIYCVLMMVIGRIGRKETDDEYISGMKLTDSPKLVNKLLSANKEKSDLKIGDLHLVKNSEIQNFLLHGTIGTGKSTVIRYILDYIISRGDRFIVYDSGGTFVETHYKEGRDFILNAHDERCANWDLWEECEEVVDYENLSNSLIPIEGNSDPFWVSSSRTIFSDSAMRMSRQENRSIEEFLEILLSLSLKSLREFLRNTPSANLVEEKIEKTAISIRSVTTNYAKSLRFLQGIDTGQEKFSIRKWMSDEKYSSSGLFISTTAIHRKSTRPLMSMWLSMATTYLQAMGENRDRRVWFIMDELPSLQKIPDLLGTIAEARKFGGCFILGMQNMAQMTDTYGKDTAKAIFDLLNTRLYGRSPSSEQAKEVEKELGNQRRWEAKEQNSFGLDQVRDGISIGRDKVYQPVVDYEDIMNLPDLTFYTRFPGKYPVIKLDIKYRHLEKRNDAIKIRAFKDKLSPLVEKLIEHNERESSSEIINDTVKATPVNKSIKSSNPSPTGIENRVISENDRFSGRFMNDNKVEQHSAERNYDSDKIVQHILPEVADSVTISTEQKIGPSEDLNAIKERLAKIRAVNSTAEVKSPLSTAMESTGPRKSVSKIVKHEVIKTSEAESTPTDISHMIEDVNYEGNVRKTGYSLVGKNIKKISNKNSGSDSDSSEMQLTAKITVVDDKLIVKSDDGLDENNTAVSLMADEEKNILRHRDDKTINGEEIEL